MEAPLGYNGRDSTIELNVRAALHIFHQKINVLSSVTTKSIVNVILLYPHCRTLVYLSSQANPIPLTPWQRLDSYYLEV